MFAALLALLPLSSCRLTNQEKPVAEPPVVKVLSVESSCSSASSTRYVGTVRPSRSVTLCANNSGRLESFSLRSGDRLSAGQQICRVESRSLNTKYIVTFTILTFYRNKFNKNISCAVY